MRAYYSAEIDEFLNTDYEHILGILAKNNQFDLTDLQRNTWSYEIEHLKTVLYSFTGRILFEYTIPRMGRRIDIVLLINNIVFLLEYKFGEVSYSRSSLDQAYDYALDLKNFQKESHDKLLVPILIATKAEYNNYCFNLDNDNIMQPIASNGSDLANLIQTLSNQYKQHSFDYKIWENSIYMPTPTIIEAAQALYRGHNVKEISRSDSGKDNLAITAQAINKIIDLAKKNRRKSIVFITGVPGAGKTLAGRKTNRA